MSRILICIDETKVDISRLRALLAADGHELRSAVLPGGDAAATIRAAENADVVISGPECWNEEAAGACADHVRLVVRFGVGLDNIDVPAMTKHGIPVANLPGYNAPAVAEIALLHMLNLNRGFVRSIDRYRGEGFITAGLGRSLDGKKIGLIGYGNIPRELRRMLRGFRVSVMASDPMLTPGDAEAEAVEKAASTESVFESCDFVSLHIPAVPATVGMVDYALLCRMKPTAFLINTARGALIREDDLIRALEEGRLCGAGLDVTAQEPLSPDHPLFHMNNVYITSHIGGTTAETDLRGQEMLAETILAFSRGVMPANIVNRNALTERN